MQDSADMFSTRSVGGLSELSIDDTCGTAAKTRSGLKRGVHPDEMLGY
jgi:hypothetical protein